MQERTMNSFNRILSNEAKMGAYYTDPTHCRWLHNLIEFPEGGFNVLEPSVGNAVALRNFLGDYFDVANKFVVDLNREVIDSLQAENCYEVALNTDFLKGLSFRKTAFTCCFSNPPYGWDESGAKRVRYEIAFLENIAIALKPEGVLVYVVPSSMLSDNHFMRRMLTFFNIWDVFRFHDEEYAKWKQVAIFAVKKKSVGYLKEDLEASIKKYSNVSELEPVPEEYEGERLVVPASNKDLVSYFRAKAFDPAMVQNVLAKSSLFKSVGSKLSTAEYSSYSIGQPPIPIKPDFNYMLEVCGVGQGLAGSEESGNLHLQRGSVSKGVTREYKRDKETGEIKSVVETQSASIKLNILETNGKLTTF